ncbi:MAG TPA: ABC transporter ATP-binding protein [Burkholderiaceae bacterium]|nr:ABC transporter ATP-binding protein [Burkholderiaceae bacterium]
MTAAPPPGAAKDAAFAVAEPLLSVAQIEVVYHRVVTAVQGVSLAVPKGAIVAILGTNGAGKTTTLRAISGFLGLDDARVTEGTIRFRGQSLENRAPHEIARLGVTLVPERDKVFPNLSVAENLRANVPRSGGRSGIGEQVFDFFPRLAQLRNRQAGYLSGGERQMLAIGAALACEPELLLIDELSLGLAPVVIEELMQRLLEIRKALDLTLVLVEQSAATALAIADHGYVMENGRVVLDGDARRLLGHPDVQEFYLGTPGAVAADGEAGRRRSYRDVKQYRRSRRWYG